jgi:demethylmenaquinone methyltransferase/2-methoxy-6-polyprenyl-1,4-benzoquinol methylase
MTPRKQEHSEDLVQRFFSGTGTSYDQIVNLCTFGFDSLWKKRILSKIPQEPIRILDQACGTGILTFKMAQKYPESQIIGVDITEEYLSIAKCKAEERGFNNVELILGKAEEVLLNRTFDCITSSYLAKYADLGILIGNARSMLRDGGSLIIHDFTYPVNQTFALVWEFYFKILQTIGKQCYPEWKTVFYELPGFLRTTRWVIQLVKTLETNRFANITVEYLTLGTSAIVTAKRA